MAAKTYRDLLVWQRALDLVTHVYRLTQNVPRDEVYGLTSQLRRAAVSVPSNIAEGQARRTTGDYIRFVSNAEGSLAELDTQLLIAVELNYIERSNSLECSELMMEVRKMLNALRRSLMARLADKN